MPKLRSVALSMVWLSFALPSTAQSLSWLDGQRPGAQAQVAIELLLDASSHGLDARDYDASTLQQMLARAKKTADPNASELLEQALTHAMLRYLHDLHSGRVAPAEILKVNRASKRDTFNALSTLRAALALQDVTLAARQAAPPLAQYDRLREALASHRALGDHTAWQQSLPPLPRPSRRLEPGQAWPGLPLLAARLTALGDEATGAPAPPLAGPYGSTWVTAVQRFQRRHGLDPDGVIGPATWAALQVPPALRVRQLELALERLRWTPLLQSPRMIVINIPEFVLRAYEVQDTQIVVRAQMKVIVGKALDTRTPLINEALRSIEFNPYWNVPASIARKELVPLLLRDPAHWEHEGFEFVNADGAADPELSVSKLQAVLAGALRIRQRPGPRNALGDIKFVFPNRDSIYLHHTPAVQLFSRARRDFSHGCIRVEHPVALARFALQGKVGWDDEQRIRDAMLQGKPSGVALAQPIPVLIAYGTALVKEGRVHFFDDVYGHDRVLDAALKRSARSASTGP